MDSSCPPGSRLRSSCPPADTPRLRHLATQSVHDEVHDPTPQPAALRAGFLMSCLISAVSFPELAWTIRAAVPSSRTGNGQVSRTSPSASVAPSTSTFGLPMVLVNLTLTV